MIESTEFGNRITGFYRGIVKAHSENGRCKIFWPGVMPDEFQDKPDELPDSEQASSLFMFGSYIEGNKGNGIFSYPEIGSIVWGFFENEDVNHPVYFAGTMMSNEENKNRFNSIKDEKHPKSVFNLTDGDTTLKVSINDGNDWIRITSQNNAEEKQSSISFSKSGNFTIDVPNGNVTINADHITINSTTSTTIQSDSQTNVISKMNTVVSSNGRVNVRGDHGAGINGAFEGYTYS